MSKEKDNATISSDINEYYREVQEVTQNDRWELARSITSANSKDVLERFETLSKEMSRRTTRDSKIEIDPNNFDLHKILLSFIKRSKEQGIELRNSGVSFTDLTVHGVDESFSVVVTVLDLLKDLSEESKEQWLNVRLRTERFFRTLMDMLEMEKWYWSWGNLGLDVRRF